MNKLDKDTDNLVALGHDVRTWFKDEEYMQWEGSHIWLGYCGMIPGFAWIAMLEMLYAKKQGTTEEARQYLCKLEDYLFEGFALSKGHYAVNQLLRLDHEIKMVCDTYRIEPDTIITMKMALDVIFAGRSSFYQRDFACGFEDKSVPDAPIVYGAMRLAADLAGVETPDSLQGRNATELGVMSYGMAVFPLTEFIGK